MKLKKKSKREIVYLKSYQKNNALNKGYWTILVSKKPKVTKFFMPMITAVATTQK